MITSVDKDEKKRALDEELKEIAQIMIDNINCHLEEKEQKERAKGQGKDSSPKDVKSSSATSGKES